MGKSDQNINKGIIMNKKYQVIYADPPWQFTNKKTGGSMRSGAEHQYLTTGIEGLKNIPVKNITADDAVLIMWYVGAMPQEAIDLVNSWGFTLKNMNGFVWNKLTKKGLPFFGMGFYTRAGSESAIIATKGKGAKLIKSHSIRAVISAKVSKHSKKPEEFKEAITNLCGDVPRLEMFARQSTDGWDVFGNEAPNSIDIK
jgi:N6-adenosine-specific RNA methylase IME4